jgi:hypothetical protein
VWDEGKRIRQELKLKVRQLLGFAGWFFRFRVFF